MIVCFYWLEVVGAAVVLFFALRAFLLNTQEKLKLK